MGLELGDRDGQSIKRVTSLRNPVFRQLNDINWATVLLKLPTKGQIIVGERNQRGFQQQNIRLVCLSWNHLTQGCLTMEGERAPN